MSELTNVEQKWSLRTTTVVKSETVLACKGTGTSTADVVERANCKNGCDACHRLKKKTKLKKKKAKELRTMIDLMVKLGVEGQTRVVEERNPVGVVNELCMKNGWRQPTYSRCPGAPPQVRCEFLDRVIVGKGNNKIAAKRDAARQVLHILET